MIRAIFVGVTHHEEIAMSERESKKITRRRFLKTSAGVVAAGALG